MDKEIVSIVKFKNIKIIDLKIDLNEKSFEIISIKRALDYLDNLILFFEYLLLI